MSKTEKRPVLGNDLDQLNNDIRKDGIILKAIYLAPILYAYIWLNSEGEFSWTKKAKEIPAISNLAKEELVTEDMFIKKQRKTVTHHSMVKNHKTVSQEKQAGEMTHFSINAIMREVVFNKNDWMGMKLVGDYDYPNSPVKNP